MKKRNLSSGIIAALSMLALANCASVTANIADGSGLKQAALQGQSLYLEPVLEDAGTELQTQNVGNYTTAVYQVKPFFAKADTRKEIHKQTMKYLQDKLGVRLATAQDGQPLLLVRTTIIKQKLSKTNLWIHHIACLGGIMLLCPAGWIYNAVAPVHSEISVQAVVQIFEIPGAEVMQRQIVKPGAIYPVFNTQGLQPLTQKELDTTVVVERGYFSSYFGQAKYGEVLSKAYSQYLAAQIASLIGQSDVTNSGAGGLGIQGSGPETNDAASDDSAAGLDTKSQTW